MAPKIQNSKVQKNIFLGWVPWGNRLLGGNLLVGVYCRNIWVSTSGWDWRKWGWQRKKLNSDAVKNKGLSGNTSHDPGGILKCCFRFVLPWGEGARFYNSLSPSTSWSQAALLSWGQFPERDATENQTLPAAGKWVNWRGPCGTPQHPLQL